MSFQEKSAWIMSLALLVGAALYAVAVVTMSTAVGQLVQPTLPAVVLYTALLVVIAITGHIAVAILGPKEANASLDERERRIFDRAGNSSGYIFGVAVILSLGVYLLSYDGDMLFYCIFASLMLGQLSEYVIRILLYRAAI